ncbi:GntR family transcriptional regulator [Nocardiopsis composta]|uniref:DNA-binding GntR family transcriptional regulator n=1 Tax=Nocardiopsis composta TaxID=157465 RepID=A0A7W8VHK2_9ACTN|nr:GntR family transcriptional regulator [Nocardiopsis composta]MBB5436134.1 DNA-binding GntR family transcriptional regulator [Nocardiopsis composta]
MTVDADPGPRRGGGARASALVLSLTARIGGLVRAEGLEEGAHLTEQWIADELQVSRSPVRRALALLEETGIVQRIPNRGYFLRRAGDDLEPVLGRIDAHGDGEDVYLRLVDELMRGGLAAEFSAAEAARRLGAPVREVQRALTRLEGEDLVRRRLGRGWEFQGALSTVQGHDHSYRFRMIVEPAALLEPGFAVDAAAFAVHRERQEALLRGRVLSASRGALFQAGADFHEMLVGCANNPVLLDAVRRQNRVRRLIEYRHQYDRTRMIGQAREHLLLLDLLEQGRTEEASRALHAHLDRVRWIKTGIGEEPPPLL